MDQNEDRLAPEKTITYLAFKSGTTNLIADCQFAIVAHQKYLYYLNFYGGYRVKVVGTVTPHGEYIHLSYINYKSTDRIQMYISWSQIEEYSIEEHTDWTFSGWQ